MTTVDTEKLRELIEDIREEAEGSRGSYYEIYGSPITPLLTPLAELLQVNLETNPELVELVLLNLNQEFRVGTGARFAELWARVEEKAEAAETSELPDYFAPKPVSSSIEGSLAVDQKADSPALWRFHWDMGHQGAVEGIFVATQREIAEALDKRVYFGDILGKHSDVHGVLEDADLTMLTAEPAAVDTFQRYVKTSGYNPLDYLEEEEEED